MCYEKTDRKKKLNFFYVMRKLTYTYEVLFTSYFLMICSYDTVIQMHLETISNFKVVFAVVLLTSGEVYTFGSNHYGQLGVGDTNIR